MLTISDSFYEYVGKHFNVNITVKIKPWISAFAKSCLWPKCQIEKLQWSLSKKVADSWSEAGKIQDEKGTSFMQES